MVSLTVLKIGVLCTDNTVDLTDALSEAAGLLKSVLTSFEVTAKFFFDLMAGLYVAGDGLQAEKINYFETIYKN